MASPDDSSPAVSRLTRSDVEDALNAAFRAVYGNLWTDELEIGGDSNAATIEKRDVARRLSALGMTSVAIADLLGSHPRSVRTWIAEARP